MAKVKKVSEYKSQVLGVNRALKVEQKSLGGCIKTLLFHAKDINLDARRVKMLKFFQDDNSAFKAFKSVVRISKAGNNSPFYVLQALNKSIATSEAEIIKGERAAAKEAAKSAPKMTVAAKAKAAKAKADKAFKNEPVTA